MQRKGKQKLTDWHYFGMFWSLWQTPAWATFFGVSDIIVWKIFRMACFYLHFSIKQKIFPAAMANYPDGLTFTVDRVCKSNANGSRLPFPLSVWQKSIQLDFSQTAAQASPRKGGKLAGKCETFATTFPNAAVIFQFVALHLLWIFHSMDLMQADGF